MFIKRELSVGPVVVLCIVWAAVDGWLMPVELPGPELTPLGLPMLTPPATPVPEWPPKLDWFEPEKMEFDCWERGGPEPGPW